jgi:glycosyltransferase involved in cell wall biosynthesis
VTPAFDIVVPTWNRRRLLLETLDSALAQTVPARVAVVDNASDDGTEDAVRARYGARVEYHRFAEHVPYQRNLTRCLELLRADVGLILHDDDLLDPGYAAAMTDAFARHPEAGVVVAGARPLQSEGSPFRRARIRSPFRWLTALGHPARDGLIALPAGALAEELVRHLRMCPYWPTLCFRRDALRSVGTFREDLGTLLDYEAWIRVSARHAVVLLEADLCSYRFHGSMMTNRLIWPHTRTFEQDVLTMSARLPELLGRVPPEDLAVRFLAKVLYPVVLLGPRRRREHYERYLAGSGYPFDRLMREQAREMDDFWRVKGWPPGLARLGWQAHRLLVRGERLRRRPEDA